MQPVAARTAAPRSAAAYEHAYGLILALSDAHTVGWLRFHEKESMQAINCTGQYLTELRDQSK